MRKKNRNNLTFVILKNFQMFVTNTFNRKQLVVIIRVHESTVSNFKRKKNLNIKKSHQNQQITSSQ